MRPDTPKRYSKRITTPLLLILSLALLASISIASFTDEWGEFQDDPSSRGFVHDETGHFTSDLGITYTDSSDGMAYQPLVVNLTGDSNLETIIYSGNFLQLYDEQMNLIDEKNIGAIEGQPIIYNNGTINIAVAIVDNTLEAWAYNGTNFIDKFANNTQLNETFVCDTWIGIKCKEESCYTMCDDGTTSFIYEINMTSATWEYHNISNVQDVIGVPSIDDIDRDGRNEIAIICDAGGTGHFGLCVFDENLTGAPVLDIGFSVDGIIDDIETGAGDVISMPVLFNIDGAGDKEVIVSFITPVATRDLSLRVYKSDGSVLWTDTFVTQVHAVLQPVMVDDGSLIVDFSVCTAGIEQGGNFHLLCSDSEGATLQESSIEGWSDDSDNSWPIIAADMDSDGLDELVLSASIIETSGDIIVNITSNNNYLVALADVNNDGELDIIATKAGITKIIYSNFTNDPPEINNTQNYGGYGGDPTYLSPVCVGTTLTFNAQECGGLADCNYDNDGSGDEERIVSNCGQLPSGAAGAGFTSTLDNGTFFGSRPTFACVFNVTGIFSVRLFLQDDSNPTDYTEYNTQTISVNVINGTAGVTCNNDGAIGSGDTGGVVASAQESQTNAAIDDTLGILFGTGAGSDKLKLIVGIALILGIIAAAYREGVKDAAGIAIVAGLATLLVTFIGLITPAIFILALALVIFVIFLGRSLTGGAPQGGGSVSYTHLTLPTILLV